MTWRSNELLDEHAYKSKTDRDAFRAGYSDGYYGYPNDPRDWPWGVYKAAYRSGEHDSGRAR